MKTKVKVAVALALALLMTLAFVACGKSDTDKNVKTPKAEKKIERVQPKKKDVKKNVKADKKVVAETSKEDAKSDSDSTAVEKKVETASNSSSRAFTSATDNGIDCARTVVPSKPVAPIVTPNKPVAPVVTPEKPVVTPEKPVVTPDKPVVTPDKPVVPEEPTVPDKPVVPTPGENGGNGTGGTGDTQPETPKGHWEDITEQVWVPNIVTVVDQAERTETYSLYRMYWYNTNQWEETENSARFDVWDASDDGGFYPMLHPFDKPEDNPLFTGYNAETGMPEYTNDHTIVEGLTRTIPAITHTEDQGHFETRVVGKKWVEDK